jgi:hypothetical protein
LKKEEGEPPKTLVCSTQESQNYTFKASYHALQRKWWVFLCKWNWGVWLQWLASRW